MTGEMPAIQPEAKPLSHSSPITLGLAIAALVGVIGVALAAGSASTRLDQVELQQRDQRATNNAQAAKDAAQDLTIAGQGKDLDVIRDTVKAIDKRMERWEERGFVQPARGGR